MWFPLLTLVPSGWSVERLLSDIHAWNETGRRLKMHCSHFPFLRISARGISLIYHELWESEFKMTQTLLKVLMEALVDLLCLMFEVFNPLICGLAKALKSFGETCNYRMSVQFHWSAKLSTVFCCDDYKWFRLSLKCVISIKRSQIHREMCTAAA